MVYAAVVPMRTLKATYIFNHIESLEEFCTEAHKSYPEQKLYIVNRTQPTAAPATFHPDRNKRGTRTLWCPYCAGPRNFVKSAFNPKKYKQCEVCGITDSNYHVRKENQLWESVTFTSDGEMEIRRFGKNARKKGKQHAKTTA